MTAIGREPFGIRLPQAANAWQLDLGPKSVVSREGPDAEKSLAADATERGRSPQPPAT